MAIKESLVGEKYSDSRSPEGYKNYWGSLLSSRFHNSIILLDFLSQMATYWFVIAWFDNQSIQKSKVRQAAKDVVKSEVYPLTYSS